MLTVPWLAAAGIALLALVLVLTVRPDTRTIAEQIQSRRGRAADRGGRRRWARSCAGPGVLPAMLASLASFGVMVSVMNLTGYVVVEMHHHPQDSVFPIVGAHVLGMYALVLVVGAADRPRRPHAGAGGGAAGDGRSTLSPAVVRRACRPPRCCCSGSASAGTSRSWPPPPRWPTAPRPVERGRLLGFNDLIAVAAGRQPGPDRRLRPGDVRRGRAGGRGAASSSCRRSPGSCGADVDGDPEPAQG